MRLCIIPSVTKLSLLTETRTGSLIELKRLFTEDFTLTTSTGTVELRFLKRGAYSQITYNSRSPPQRSPDGSVSSSDDTISALDRNPPIMVRDTPITNNQGGTNSPTQ